MTSNTLKFPRFTAEKSCGQPTESGKMPVEIAEHGNDSLGGSLTLLTSGVGSARSSRAVEAERRQDQAEPCNTAHPSKLPDPWLFDSEALLREIARCRETVLQVPITNPNATHFGIQLAVSALWNLEQNVRYLLHLHREGQRSFGKRVRKRGDSKHQTIYVTRKPLWITFPITLLP